MVVFGVDTRDFRSVTGMSHDPLSLLTFDGEETIPALGESGAGWGIIRLAEVMF
jgi:hypothetical protein